MAQIQHLKSAAFHIDQALSLIGFGKGGVARRFASGELIRPIGEAERAAGADPDRPTRRRELSGCGRPVLHRAVDGGEVGGP